MSLSEIEDQLVAAFGGRWLGFHRGTLTPGAAVWAQFDRHDSGRWVLTGLLLLGDGLKSADLRGLSVSRLENGPNLSGTQRTGERTVDQVHREAADLPPLRREPGMPPEEFSRVVAAHYNVWAQAVPHPVAAMAAEWNVKLATMHTWVREARLRGVLAPGRIKRTVYSSQTGGTAQTTGES